MIDSSQIVFSRAVEQSEYLAAFRCLYRSYHRRGLITCTRQQQMRLTRYHLLPETRVFIARSGDRVLATISLIDDAPLGVPLRTVFGDEIHHIASAVPRLAEAGCLAIDPAVSTDGLYVVHHLMGLVAQSAARRGVARILIAVHPRHAPFYERVAGFQRFAGPAPHPSVDGAPAIGLQLNLANLYEEYPRVWQRYFGMHFSPLALSTRPATAAFLKRMARLWQTINDQPLTPTPAAPSPTAPEPWQRRMRPTTLTILRNNPPREESGGADETASIVSKAS